MKTISQVTINILRSRFTVTHLGIIADSAGSVNRVMEADYPLSELLAFETVLVGRGYVRQPESDSLRWWQKLGDDGALVERTEG